MIHLLVVGVVIDGVFVVVGADVVEVFAAKLFNNKLNSQTRSFEHFFSQKLTPECRFLP